MNNKILFLGKKFKNVTVINIILTIIQFLQQEYKKKFMVKHKS